MSEQGRENSRVEVNNRKCRRCFYCVQLCPAKAIKLEKESIRIIPERCILCGNCITGCPHRAMTYQSDASAVRDLIEANENVVACLDPAFPAVLDNVTPWGFSYALKALGFKEVWEGAIGAELISAPYRKLLAGDLQKPVISSFCPVIVSYIEKYLPQLVGNLAPIVSPMIAAGRAIKKAKGEGWRVVYISPCLARMGEMDYKENSGAVDNVITFRDVRFMFAEAGINPRRVDEAPFDGPVPALGRIVPVIGGLNRSLGHSFDVLVGEVSVAYGRRRVMAALNQLARGSIQARFFDLVFCDGCVDGSFVERELSVVGRRQIVSSYAKSQIVPMTASMLQRTLRDFADVDITRNHEPNVQKLPDPSEERIRAVLKKINKLPPHNNLDCRSCGYNTCREKAVAVVQGISEAEYCLPYLLEDSKRVYQQLEKSHRELQQSHQELEQAQFQLIRTEKLAALGQLAAGVAHEINNPLGTITIYAHILARSLDADDPRKEDIDLIISEANRTKEIVQGLLSFARETKLKPGETNINDLIEETLGLLVNQVLFQNIKIKKTFGDDIPMLFADATQLKQVFLNIMLNAAQAMAGKGSLVITTAHDAGMITVKIKDTGPGIPPENVGKLFNPFFTTKEKGTGLGLAISYGIVERHSGQIDVDTELGKGSTFIITLPVDADSAGILSKAKGLAANQNINTGRRNYGTKKNSHH
ncbi:MAG: [Fe-Fe] hydrogenase large subunit C-terminal domain-containing protein [Syntrophorhabdaceae bacterium]|nr:[Fe-Fe] hydrogenase large subunit C-terminal domain-containing protein [Syntrophorhabdaceae bacterium]